VGEHQKRNSLCGGLRNMLPVAKRRMRTSGSTGRSWISSLDGIFHHGGFHSSRKCSAFNLAVVTLFVVLVARHLIDGTSVVESR
jgi:hypothetical protein